MLMQGHAGLLRELLANLLDNAIQYTPPGGEITVELHRQGRSCVWQCVIMAPALRCRTRQGVPALLPGQQQRGGKGCGLGLAIVQEIARRHHTRVELSDNPPHGLCASLFSNQKRKLKNCPVV
jgi:two-component system sensor histidine kinase TctE